MRSAARALLLVVALATVLAACSYSSEVAAHSGPATIGVPHKIELSGCDVKPSGPTIVDFDESLWLPVGTDPAELASPPADGDGPDDTGTITLVAPDQAEYRSDRGPVFTFERQAGTLSFEGCVPWAYTPDER